MLDYLTDDDLADLDIVCETEVTREEIKAGLYTTGTWKIHCVDSAGRTWFIRSTPAPVDAPAIKASDVHIHFFDPPEDGDDE